MVLILLHFTSFGASCGYIIHSSEYTECAFPPFDEVITIKRGVVFHAK
jgi:hypothetical protein